MIRALIARGIGFSDGTRFIPTLGLGTAPVPVSTPSPVPTVTDTGLVEHSGTRGGYLAPQQYGEDGATVGGRMTAVQMARLRRRKRQDVEMVALMLLMED